MIITSTPLRISFFGGGTDCPVWFREHGGSVLATAIDKRCYITCRRLPPFFKYHSRVSYSKVENVTRNEAIEHPSARACLQFLGISEGVEIHHVADLPARTGLGTSSAFTVGSQDQVSAAYGGFNRINFQTDNGIEVRRVLTSPDRLSELEKHLALYFTGFSRTASEIATQQLDMTPHKKKELGAMLQIVDEAEAI